MDGRILIELPEWRGRDLVRPVVVTGGELRLLGGKPLSMTEIIITADLKVAIGGNPEVADCANLATDVIGICSVEVPIQGVLRHQRLRLRQSLGRGRCGGANDSGFQLGWAPPRDPFYCSP